MNFCPLYQSLILIRVCMYRRGRREDCKKTSSQSSLGMHPWCALVCSYFSMIHATCTLNMAFIAGAHPRAAAQPSALAGSALRCCAHTIAAPAVQRCFRLPTGHSSTDMRVYLFTFLRRYFCSISSWLQHWGKLLKVLYICTAYICFFRSINNFINIKLIPTVF